MLYTGSMETKTRIGDEEERFDELTFEPVPEPSAATGLILESLRRREPTSTIR